MERPLLQVIVDWAKGNEERIELIYRSNDLGTPERKWVLNQLQPPAPSPPTQSASIDSARVDISGGDV